MAGLDLLGPDHRNLFIGGEWRPAEGDKRLDVIDPADGSVLTDVADASTTTPWPPSTPRPAPRPSGPRRRRASAARSCARAFELLTERAGEFAELMSLEMGKTIAEAKGEVTYGAEFFRWFSEEAVRIHGRWMHDPAGVNRLLTIKKPVGRACS